ncbi:MAG: GNAT family N-acetyltransferase [Phycisphaerales bacterium]|nr:GNAT family N-acetyltransferase [Phycisphaerales bacterium]
MPIMTVFSPSGPATGEQGSSPKAGRIPQNLRLSACERLVSGPDRQQAARNLIGSASAHGIDLNLLWGVIQRDQVGPARVRQACLAVLGAGATAMIFHSSPDRDRWLGTRETQCDEISASLRACLQDLRTMTDRVRLAQCLIEPRNRWASDVFIGAGMIFVGELAYLRKRLEQTPPRHVPEPDWPEGISVRPLRDLQHGSIQSDREALITALEASYIDTLDCPELCGLRNMDDVVDSHMATGVFNASHWLLIERDAQPVGCCLLSHCPASGSIELVYLGLGARARGLGLGRQVLRYATERMTHLGAKEITCAVDTRNTPALRVYESLGYTRFDSRLGFVSPIAPT